MAYEDPLTDRGGRFVDLGAEVREAAAAALAKFDDDAAEAALVRGLADPEDGVRSAAIGALRERGDGAAERALRRTVASLVDRDGELGEADRVVVGRLAEAAGADESGAAAGDLAERLGRAPTAARARTLLEWLYPDSAEILLAALRTPGRAAYEAALALGAAHDARAVAPLCELLRLGGDTATRGAAAWALGLIRHPDAAGSLLEATFDDDYSVRSQAMESFDRLGNAGVVLAARLLDRPALETETETETPAANGTVLPSVVEEQPPLARTTPVLRRLLGR